MDYYTSIIEEVKKLMKDEQVDDAFKILQEELAMPYIPKDSEDQLVELYNQCTHVRNAKAPAKTLNIDQVEELLHGSLDEQYAAVDLLASSNVRKHLDIIEAYLKDDPHYLIRSMLIEVLIDQQINDEMITRYEGMDVTFTPCFVEKPMEADGALQSVNYLRSWFEDDNPTFAMMCVETLVKEAYLHLPFNIDEDESLPFALAVSDYVFAAHQEQAAFEVFVSEKGLAKYRGYELLLWKHDI